MENMQEMQSDFDAEKIMEMSREDAISLLGEENASIVNEGLKSGTLSYSEFEKICNGSFPIPQQSQLVRNVIFTQLSQSECFNMFESNKEKQKQYAKIARLRETAEKGELTQEDLKQLCDQVFGENSDMSRKVQNDFIAKGKIKPRDIQVKKEPLQKSSEEQGKKSWELEPEEKARIQKETAEMAQKHQEQQNQVPNQELQQGQANDQQSMVDIGEIID